MERKKTPNKALHLTPAHVTLLRRERSDQQEVYYRQALGELRHLVIRIMRWSLTLLFLIFSIFACLGEEVGQTSLQRKSRIGLEGWTQAEYRHSKGAWMNSILVIKAAEGDMQTFRAQYAFIIGWDFCHNDTCVVIQSQNSHGPYYWQLFDISTGKLLDEYFRYKADKFPDWVIDFTEHTK